jgi:hypothetical protein
MRNLINFDPIESVYNYHFTFSFVVQEVESGKGPIAKYNTTLFKVSSRPDGLLKQNKKQPLP